jgi:hypothetical protein
MSAFGETGHRSDVSRCRLMTLSVALLRDLDAARHSQLFALGLIANSTRADAGVGHDLAPNLPRNLCQLECEQQ